MKKYFKDFKDFISRGNVLDLAVGMIIGAAFTVIVKSMVNDILMPLIGNSTNSDISEWKHVLKPEVATIDAAGVKTVTEVEIAIRYGTFIQAIIDFLLIGLTLFIIIKVVTTLVESGKRAKEKLAKKDAPVVEETPAEPVVVPPSEEVVLLTEIRDALKKNNK